MLEKTDVLFEFAKEHEETFKGIMKVFKDFLNRLKNAIKKLAGDKWGNSKEAEAVRLYYDKLADIYKKAAKETFEALSNAANSGENTKSAENKKAPKGGKVQYSGKNEQYTEYEKPITVADVILLRSIGRKSVSKFTSEDLQKAQKWAYKFYKELGTRSPFFRAWFGDWRAHENNPNTDAILVKYGYAEYLPIDKSKRKIKNLDTDFEITIDGNIVGDSVHYAAINGDKKQINQVLGRIDDIVKYSILLDTQISIPNKSNKKGHTTFMHYLYCPITVNNAPFLVKLTVEEYGIGSERRGYNVQRIKMSTLQAAQFSKITRKSRKVGSSAMDSISISELYSLVKQYDKEFSPAPEVNPLLLNEDGTPKVFYHGTDSKFTSFSPEEMSSREGSYFFAENKEDAAAYGEYIMPVYLVGRNLADYDNQPSEFYKLRSKREQVQWLKDRGYDGWYADMDSGGWGEVSVFSPTQVKSATDNIGTFDRNNPDIRYSRKSGRSSVYHAYEIMDLFGIKKTAENRDTVASTLEQIVNAARMGGADVFDDTVSRDMAMKAAEFILPEVKKQRSERAQTILHEIRGTKVYIDEYQLQEIKNTYGNWQTFSRGLMGYIYPTQSREKADCSLDQMWQEWSEQYPDFFDAGVVGGDGRP